METANRRAWNDWKSAHGHWSATYLVGGLGAAVVTAIASIQVYEWEWSFAGQIWVGVFAFFSSLIVWGCSSYLWFRYRAPIRQGNEAQQRLEEIERSIAPTLSITLGEREPDINKDRGFGWGLTITNNGVDDVGPCYAHLLAVRWENPEESHELSIIRKELHWPAHGIRRLISSQEPARLAVVFGYRNPRISPTMDNFMIEIAYAEMNPEQRRRVAINSRQPFLMLIQIAAPGQLPQYVACRAHGNGMVVDNAIKGSDPRFIPLKILGISEDRPDLSKWQITPQSNPETSGGEREQSYEEHREK